MRKSEIIIKSKLIHGDKFDYSLIKDNTRRRDKTEIICPTHGVFSQYVGNHLTGSGCKKCDYENNRIKSIEKTIYDLNIIHNDKYTYDISLLKNNRELININCALHGWFKQKVITHLNGFGCPICGGSKKLTNEEFILKANKIHSNIYNYQNIQYKNTDTKICIICNLHGEFYQTPHSHLTGVGCPSCKSSKGEKFIINYLLENNLKYISQKTFTNCKNLKELPFDFYLPDYNLCIEFDGEQHYRSVKYFGGEAEFKKRKHNDNIKNEYCDFNKIKLIRIPYFEIDNINDILKKEFKHYENQENKKN